MGDTWLSAESSDTITSFAPGAPPPLGFPAPPWLPSMSPRSSNADQNGSHTGSLYGAMNGLGAGKFTPRSPAPGPLGFPHGGVDVPHG